MRQTAPFPLPATGVLRLKTLVLIRWVAIFGQLGALGAACYFLENPPALALPLLAIAISIIVNLAVTFFLKLKTYIDNTSATLSLLFDLLQLTLLLHVTGGLSNPFVVLMLAPMTVAATALAGRSVIIITSAGLAGLTFLFLLPSHPLWSPENLIPSLFLVGEYSALMITTIFLVVYARRVAREARRLTDTLNRQNIRLEREQKLSAFGALAAAVAHELGSPLSTIAIITRELTHSLKTSPHADDINLLEGQIARCRTILSDFAKHNQLGDKVIHYLPLSAWLQRAAQPYLRHDREFEIWLLPSQGDEPQWPLQPALLHGVGNLLQNAFQFSRHQVKVDVMWNNQTTQLCICDDGAGFAPDLLPRLGHAYTSGRNAQDAEDHMGLGLFIAKILLERSGANLEFANQFLPDSGAEAKIVGAKITLNWHNPPTA